MPSLVRITINGNPYRVPEGLPVAKADIRRRLAGKPGLGNLPGFDKARVEYHKFLQKTWKPVGKGLRFRSGMAFRVLIKAKRKRGCSLVETPEGRAFVCRRGD